MTTLDLSHWDADFLMTGYMFKGCENLVNLNLANWNVRDLVLLQEMFYGCSQLTNLDTSNWKLGICMTENMFCGCTKLQSLYKMSDTELEAALKSGQLPVISKSEALTCKNCGATLPENAKFCLECGSKVARMCSSCGAMLPEHAKFCLECGTRVAGI